MTNGRKTEESLNHRRNNKERNETDGVWNEGGEREGRRGGHGDKLERALTNGTATVFRIKMKPAQTTARQIRGLQDSRGANNTRATYSEGGGTARRRRGTSGRSRRSNRQEVDLEGE